MKHNILLNSKLRSGFAPIIILFIVVAIGFVAYSSYKNNNTETKLINPSDNICQTDSDCVTATTECSCDCGIPINKQNLDKYLTRKESKCKLYFGKMCKMSCTQIPSCINNKCTISNTQTPASTYEFDQIESLMAQTKEYKSNYGWSINYPRNWYVYDKGFGYKDKNGKIIWFNDYKNVFFSPNKFPEYIPEGSEFVFEGFGIGYVNPNNWPEHNPNFENIWNSSVKDEKMQIDGKRVIKSIYDSRQNDNSIPSAYKGLNVQYYIDYNWDSLKILQLSFDNIDKSKILSEGLADRILSTFKFPK